MGESDEEKPRVEAVQEGRPEVRPLRAGVRGHVVLQYRGGHPIYHRSDERSRDQGSNRGGGDHNPVHAQSRVPLVVRDMELHRLLPPSVPQGPEGAARVVIFKEGQENSATAISDRLSDGSQGTKAKDPVVGGQDERWQRGRGGFYE